MIKFCEICHLLHLFASFGFYITIFFFSFYFVLFYLILFFFVFCYSLIGLSSRPQEKHKSYPLFCVKFGTLEKTSNKEEREKERK